LIWRQETLPQSANELPLALLKAIRKGRRGGKLPERFEKIGSVKEECYY
jgi:hypothetical protein